jgi:hypothetical protein
LTAVPSAPDLNVTWPSPSSEGVLVCDFDIIFGFRLKPDMERFLFSFRTGKPARIERREGFEEEEGSCISWKIIGGPPPSEKSEDRYFFADQPDRLRVILARVDHRGAHVLYDV